MDKKVKNSKRNSQLWLAIGAVILIILLIVWLSEADLWGDTDVNAVMSLLPR